MSGFWYGIGTTLALMAMCTYTALLLSRCWMILLKRWPMYRSHTYGPYGEIAYRATGKFSR